MDFFDVDIHVGGSSHNLLDSEVQEDYMSRILEGEFDVVILLPPCGTWSRANWANDDGPAPCRDRFHPWGFENNKPSQRKRAETGNEFVQGFSVRCLLEHPEEC